MWCPCWLAVWMSDWPRTVPPSRQPGQHNSDIQLTASNLLRKNSQPAEPATKKYIIQSNFDKNIPSFAPAPPCAVGLPLSESQTKGGKIFFFVNVQIVSGKFIIFNCITLFPTLHILYNLSNHLIGQNELRNGLRNSVESFST